MSAGPLSALILAKYGGIAEWRSLMGPTKVLKTVHEQPESLRGLYGLSDSRNGLHGSDSEESAKRDIEFFYPEVDYNKLLKQVDNSIKNNLLYYDCQKRIPDDLKSSSSDNSLRRKSRNISEKKRRDQFNLLINELWQMVSSNGEKMDKVSILKAAIDRIKEHGDESKTLKDDQFNEELKPFFFTDVEFSRFMMEALDAIFLVLDKSGTILYVSRTIFGLLGFAQSEIENKSVYDYIHPSDCKKLYDLLNLDDITLYKETEKNQKNQLCVELHMKRRDNDYFNDKPVFQLVRISGLIKKRFKSEQFDILPISNASLDNKFDCIKTPLKFSICVYEASRDKYISASLRGTGVWEKRMSKRLLKALSFKKNSILIDIGANIGYFTLLAANFGHNVIAVEPNLESARRLSVSVALNGFHSNVTIVRNALFDRICRAEMTRNDDNQGGIWIKRCTPKGDVRTTFLQHLSAIVSPSQVGVLKLDVEGFECRVLERSEGFLKTPYIFMEWNKMFIKRNLYSTPCTEVQIQAMVHTLLQKGYVAHDIDSGNQKSYQDPINPSDINEERYFSCSIRLLNATTLRELGVVDEKNNEFSTRYNLEWKFLYIDQRAPFLIGYMHFELLGTSCYQYCHPDDILSVFEGHTQLLKVGQHVSNFYRFLTKGQQWIWIRTHYFITYNQWNSRPEFISGTHTVYSASSVRQQYQQLPSCAFSEKSESQNLDLNYPMRDQEKHVFSLSEAAPVNQQCTYQQNIETFKFDEIPRTSKAYIDSTTSDGRVDYYLRNHPNRKPSVFPVTFQQRYSPSQS
ncbi:DgyrCDS5197 [Dimorphilus gyrociliatus]|uniref:DgyrCDS5197 n=1 Tax=Dimorphilus gyrociliatus TaxID=2664684 RepID=A0A7I8VJS7_9ANNE|nr:DgyrCDS5197 [Dimorphilus gyrociliatus]